MRGQAPTEANVALKTQKNEWLQLFNILVLVPQHNITFKPPLTASSITKFTHQINGHS